MKKQDVLNQVTQLLLLTRKHLKVKGLELPEIDGVMEDYRKLYSDFNPFVDTDNATRDDIRNSKKLHGYLWKIQDFIMCTDITYEGWNKAARAKIMKKVRESQRLVDTLTDSINLQRNYYSNAN